MVMDKFDNPLQYYNYELYIFIQFEMKKILKEFEHILYSFL